MTLACRNYGFKERKIFAEVAAAVASSPNSLLSTWKGACRGIRWPKTFASHCLASVCALSVSVAVLTDTTEGAHGWGWHWRLLSIFSSRFRCLQAIYSYCFIFILFVVVVQFNNTSNFGHMLNLKKAEVVTNFILFFKNVCDKYPPVFYLGNTTEIYNPVCCEVKALCMDETQL